MKCNIQLRKKAISSGGYSLYLDYTVDGQRHKEYLKMYINKGTDQRTKMLNKRTMEAAQMIQAQRLIDLQNGKAGINTTSNITFTDYFLEVIERKTKSVSPSTISILKSTLKLWKSIVGDKVKLRSITTKHIKKYTSGLRDLGYKPNTIAMYYTKVCMVFHNAMRDKLIPRNPIDELAREDVPRKQDANRTYLTIDELRLFAQATIKPKQEIYRQMFMFSCYTGLRYSDLIKVTWRMIDEGILHMTMTKTKSIVSVPLSGNAIKWLPKRGVNQELPIFSRIKYPSTLDYILKDIAHSCGINKNVSIHTARHTFATLELTYGADIYTVSKLLGHTDISTTQIYAKIVDKKKEEAVNLLPEI